MEHSRDDDGGYSAEPMQEPRGEPIVCYACETELPEGRRHCPGCGRSQLRTCYCGADIPVTAMECPHCGADWSQSARVRRRKARSHRPRPAEALSYALVGAVLAALAAALIGLILDWLAGGALAPGESMPPGPLDRLVLAAQTVLTALGVLWAFIADRGRSLLGLLLVLLAGAGAGALYYMVRAGRHHHNRIKRTSGQAREVVRVKRRRA